MKASLDGTRLALARTMMLTALSPRLGGFEVFDFDASSGTVSNPIVSDTLYRQIYGIEFSPDGSKLYFANNSNTLGVAHDIYQVNLLAGSSTDILNSATIIGTSPRPNASSLIGAFQLGRDGKIYVARFGETFLGVINSPNELGVAANYVSNGISLSGRISRAGLPNFIYGFDAIGVVLSSNQLVLNGILENQSVRLSWQITDYHIEGKIFEIYRSEDAFNFQKIAVLKGSELTQSNGKYHWIDNNLPHQISKFYYKLIQKNTDGKHIQSNWVYVWKNTNSDFILFPNPFIKSKNQTIHIIGAQGTADLKIISHLGKIVFEKSIHIFENSTSIELPISYLANGIYQIILTGKNTTTTRLVVLD